jgi:hypothetical protein
LEQNNNGNNIGLSWHRPFSRHCEKVQEKGDAVTKSQQTNVWNAGNLLSNAPQ